MKYAASHCFRNDKSLERSDPIASRVKLLIALEEERFRQLEKSDSIKWDNKDKLWRKIWLEVWEVTMIERPFPRESTIHVDVVIESLFEC